MVSLGDHGYSGIGNCGNIHHFLQGIWSTELEAVVNVVQPEKYSKDFDATVSYFGQMVTKEGNIVLSVHTAKTRSQLAKSKVTQFMGKIECKNIHGRLKLNVQRATGAS